MIWRLLFSGLYFYFDCGCCASAFFRELKELGAANPEHIEIAGGEKVVRCAGAQGEKEIISKIRAAREENVPMELVS